MAFIPPCSPPSILASAARAGADDYVLTIKNHQFSAEGDHHPGQPTENQAAVTVKNTDNVAAEFESSDLDREKVVKPGSEITVFLGPLDAGTYGFFNDFDRSATGTDYSKITSLCLATLIIVFREIIEAGLVVGIVMAATKGVPRRGAITSPMALPAVFWAPASWRCLPTRSAPPCRAAGQGEMFNVAVLSIAVCMLTWHNVWMARHGRGIATMENESARA